MVTPLIPHGKKVLGIGTRVLRAAISNLVRFDSATVYDLAVVLGIPELQAKPIWDRMAEWGFIVEEGGRWVPASGVEAVARARIGKPLPRARARELLDQLVANAKAVNSMSLDEPVYFVTKICVFGSYLNQDKQELGDLDVAWEVEERPGVEGYAHWAMMNGRDSLAHTRGLVRPRTPAVRLIEFERLVSLKCPYEVVYEFGSPDIHAVRQARAARRAEYRAAFDEMRSAVQEIVSR